MGKECRALKKEPEETDAPLIPFEEIGGASGKARLTVWVGTIGSYFTH